MRHLKSILLERGRGDGVERGRGEGAIGRGVVNCAVATVEGTEDGNAMGGV